MKKHTSTTRMIGSGYPLSVKLLDLWYHRGDHIPGVVIFTLLLAVAVVGGAVRDQRSPAPAAPAPVILIQTAAIPAGHPLLSGAGSVPAHAEPAPVPTVAPEPFQDALAPAPAEVAAPPTAEPVRAEVPAWEPPAPIVIMQQEVTAEPLPPVPTDMPLNVVQCDYGCGKTPPAAAPTVVVDPNYRKDDFKEPDQAARCAFVGCLPGH